jgi:hypothetical protein
MIFIPRENPLEEGGEELSGDEVYALIKTLSRYWKYRATFTIRLGGDSE